jgi:putative membrane protein
MDSAHQSKVDKLKGLSGSEFDRQYDEMQVDAHETAVSLFD